MADDSAEFELLIKNNTDAAITAMLDDLNSLTNALAKDQDALNELQGSLKVLVSEFNNTQTAIKGEEEALLALVAQKNALQDANEVDIASYRKLEKAITASEAKLAASKSSLVSSGDKINAARKKEQDLIDGIAGKKDKIIEQETKIKDALKKTGKEGGRSLKDLFDSAKKAGGPLGNLAGKGGDVLDVFQKSGGLKAALGIGMVAATAAMAVALAAGAAALAKFAFGTVLAARSQFITLKALKGSTEETKQLVNSIDEVVQSSSLAKDAVQGYAVSLTKAKISGDLLTIGLHAIGTAATVLGDEAGKSIESIIKKSQELGHISVTTDQLKAAGLEIDDIASALSKNLGISFAQAKAAVQSGTVSVTDSIQALNTSVQDKFGALAKERLLDPEFLFGRFSERVKGLFDGVNMEPLLNGLDQLLHLFDKNTVMGKIISELLEKLFNPLFDAIGKAAPLVERFFLLMMIYALETKIALFPLYMWIKKITDGFDTSGLVSFEDVAKIVFGVIAVLVAGVVISFMLLYWGIKAVVAIVVTLYKIFDAFFSWLGTISWVETGVNLVKGLANGIKNAASWVIEAISNLAKDGIDALKSWLKIKSPSRVMMEIGYYTSEGMALGVEKGGDQVVKATKDVGQSTIDAANKTSKKVGVNGSNSDSISSGKVIHIENINYMGPMDHFENFKVQMKQFLREEALNLGVGIESPIG